jgi:DNA (cytosine-5)-methyltransferase 1
MEHISERETGHRMVPGIIRSENLKTCRGERVRLEPELQREDARVAWHDAIADPDTLIALDLFCGAGGLSYGMQCAGFLVAAGIDSDPDACETHAYNCLSKTLCCDIQTIRDPCALMEELGIPRVDVIIGGPPCQGFSIAGRAKLRSLSREEREEIYARNYLYREFVRFVAAIKPLFFVMENVPHLSSFADGIIAREIQEDFGRLGYCVYPELLDAADYGVPQTRRRLFFIGTRLGWVYRRPRPTHGRVIPYRTLADAIADLPAVPAPSLEEERPYVPRERPDLNVSGEYARLMRSAMPPEQRDLLYDHVVRPVRADDAEIFRLMRPGDRYRDVDPQYRRYEIKRVHGDEHFADRYYKLRWDEPCITITAHIAHDGYRYIYPDSDQPRTLSVREAARVQSFPDHFRFAGYRTSRFRQIGNAVPPLLAEAIGHAIARAIRDYREGCLTEHPWQPPLPVMTRSSGTRMDREAE